MKWADLEPPPKKVAGTGLSAQIFCSRRPGAVATLKIALSAELTKTIGADTVPKARFKVQRGERWFNLRVVKDPGGKFEPTWGIGNSSRFTIPAYEGLPETGDKRWCVWSIDEAGGLVIILPGWALEEEKRKALEPKPPLKIGAAPGRDVTGSIMGDPPAGRSGLAGKR
jgi:hypothetical protein